MQKNNYCIYDFIKFGRWIMVLAILFSLETAGYTQKKHICYVGTGAFIHHRYFNSNTHDSYPYDIYYVTDPDNNNLNHGYYSSLFFGWESKKWIHNFGTSYFVNDVKYSNEKIVTKYGVSHGPTDWFSRRNDHSITDFHFRIKGFSVAYNIGKIYPLLQRDKWALDWIPGFSLGMDVRARINVIKDEGVNYFSGSAWDEDTSYNYTPVTTHYTSFDKFQFNKVNLFCSFNSKIRVRVNRFSFYSDMGVSGFTEEFFMSDLLSQARRSFYYGIACNFYLNRQ